MKNNKVQKFSKSLVLATVVILGVFSLIFGSWGSVYAAQDSLPGDPLYRLKLAQEDLQFALTTDTQTRIHLLTTYADRRMEEATTLVLAGQQIPAEVPNLIRDYLEELTNLTADMDSETQQAVLDGVQRHLRPRDQDQGMTGPINSPVHDPVNNPPPRDMNKNGKGQESTDILSELTALSPSLEITTTQTITPGMYGPGPCVAPECSTPLADEHSPGPYWGIPVGPGNQEGYGPGFDTQGQIPQQTKTTSGNGNSSNPPGQGGQP